MTKEFKKLCEIEPRLKFLYYDIKRVAENTMNDGAFCANVVWYSVYKPSLLRLVGYIAENPLLKSEKDYDIAYQELYNLLPDCRNCGCL